MSASHVKNLGLLLVAVVLLGGAAISPALAQDAAETAGSVVQADAGEIRPDIPGIWWIAPVGALIALFFAFKFYGEVKAADEGDP